MNEIRNRKSVNYLFLNWNNYWDGNFRIYLVGVMATEDQQLLNKIKWALSRIEKSAYNNEHIGGLYSAGLRDARKTIESALFKELDEGGYMTDVKGGQMSTNEEILRELVSIRKLLERDAKQEYSGEPFKWGCLACGQHHANGTPCPHMITYCKGDI